MKVEVEDYHEFGAIQDTLRAIIPSKKVKEIGFIAPNYVGVIYIGKVTDPAVKKLIEEIKEDEKLEDNDGDDEES